MVNRTGISDANGPACLGSLVAYLRGVVVEPVHIELVAAETRLG